MGVIETWRKVRALSAADRRLLAEAGALLVLVRIGLWIVPFRTLRRLLPSLLSPLPDGREERKAYEGLSGAANTPTRVSWAIRVVSRRLPGLMTCLVQALAADAVLRRRGYAPRLRIGVRERGSQGSRPLEAHAWVECDGVLVVGGLENLPDYVVLSASERP